MSYEIYTDSFYSFSVLSGDISVTKNSGDNSYSISGVLTLSNDEVVTVSYSGAFEYEDESQITKSSIKSNKLFKK